MKRFSLAILFLTLLAISMPLLYESTIHSESQQGYLAHYTIYVEPRSFVKQGFDICGGYTVEMIFYVYDTSGTSNDIVFRILAPDGREIPQGENL